MNLIEHFPILHQKVNGVRLAYLDNAATTQKPQCVIDALSNYYLTQNANVNRGVHFLSEQATQAFDLARQKIQKFINAQHLEECIFVRGATEGINLVANCMRESVLDSTCEILVTQMEHHSNLLPWQVACQRTQAKLNYIPLQNDGSLDLSDIDALLSPQTKLLAITHVSNSLGTLNPIKELIQKAHAKNILVLIDGTQAPAHLQVDVQQLDCDFYVISAHKFYGPMGVGLVFGKKHLLEKLPPYQYGGEMVFEVNMQSSSFAPLPMKFEAGTPAVAEIVAWSACLDFLQKLDRQAIFMYEKTLLEYAHTELTKISGLQVIGTAPDKLAVISFLLADIHPHDIGTIVNHHGVAIRSGHHCTQPIMDFYKIPSTARMSLGMYNTPQDIEQLVQALQACLKMFKR